MIIPFIGFMIFIGPFLAGGFLGLPSSRFCRNTKNIVLMTSAAAVGELLTITSYYLLTGGAASLQIPVPIYFGLILFGGCLAAVFALDKYGCKS